MNAAILATTRDAGHAATGNVEIAHGIVAAPAPVATAATAVSRGRRLRRRHLWLVPGLAIAIYANLLGEQHHVGILALIAFGIAPDLPRWIMPRLGSVLASISIPLSNLLHQPLVAFAALAVSAAGAVNGIVPMVVLVASLIWSSHVVIGWGVGDGIRHPEARR